MKDSFERLIEAGQHPSQDLLDEIAALGQPAIPRLIEIATDHDLIWAESESPEVWAPTHAIQLLGRLQAAQAVEPLLTLLRDEEADWLYEEIPSALTQIGPAIVGPLKAFASDRANDSFKREAAVRSLIHLVPTHPQMRDDLMSFFRAFLSPYADETPEDEVFRGHLIADLLDIDARELYPDIEAAYLGNHVDEMIVGLDSVQQEWGIDSGASPRKQAGFELRLKCTACEFVRSHALDYVYYDEGTAERQKRGEQVPYDPVVIPQEIVCPRCGAVDQYELAAEAYFKMTAELLKVVAQAQGARLPEEFQGTERLRLIHFAMQGDRSAHPFEAMDHYREQIEQHPRQAAPHLRLGNVLRFLGRWEAATAEYERALELNPDDAGPLAAQAELELLRDETGRAIELFEVYLGRTPVRPQDQEDAEIWDRAHVVLELYRSQGGERLAQLVRSDWGAAQAASSVAFGQLEAPSLSTDSASGSRTIGAKPNVPNARQARRKRKAKRKSARKARKRKK